MIDAEEGTNFDFYIAFASSGRVCFELKLTEQEFGKADADAAHLKKLQDFYRPRLAGKVREEALAPESFFAQYQIMRNVAYADPLGNGFVYFIFPRANRALAQKQSFIDSIVAAELRGLVRVIHLEDLIRLSLTRRVANAPEFSPTSEPSETNTSSRPFDLRGTHWNETR